MILSGTEIMEEAKRRKGIASHRLETYRRSRDAYFGDGAGTPVRSSDAQGRPLLRFEQIRAALGARHGAPNMLMPIVDDFVALKGALPTLRVLPWDDTDDARTKSAKFSRVLRTQWLQSRMEIQAYRMAWHLSALGDCLLTLNPIFPDQATGLKRPGVYISVVDPSTAFPQFKVGWECEELEDVIIWERLPREQVKARWGLSYQEEKIDVFWYISGDYNCVSVNGSVVESVRHGLSFCPAQWIKNKLNGRPAQSDIHAAIDSHDEMQVMVMVMNDSLLESTYSQLVIKNPVNVQEQFEVGPGAEPIVIQGDGDVTRLAPSPPPQSAQMLMQNMWELIQRIAGSAPVRTENAISGSNISGKSVHAQQGPMETRLAASQTIIGYHLQSLNSKILYMLWDLPEFRDEVVDIFGTEKGKPYKISFRGEELDGWTRNQIQWSALIGSTSHERSVVGLSLKQADLVPDEWVLDQIGIDDSEMLISQARTEAKDRMQQQAAMQQQMQPQGGGPGGPGPQAQPPSGGAGQPDSAGAQSQPAPPGLPPFPPVDTAPTQAGLGTPSPVPDVAAQITETLNKVGDQLMGKVVTATPTPGGVHITLDEPDAKSDHNDRMILRQAFAEMGRVTFSKVAA